MGEFLVPLLIMLIVAGVVMGGYYLLKSKSKKASNSGGILGGLNALRQPVTAEQAREAAAKLSADNHKQVYGLIARGNHHGAAEAYAEITGTNFLQAIAAIAALSTYPQASTGSAPRQDTTAGDISDVVEFDDEDTGHHPDQLELPLDLDLNLTDADFDIPADWAQEAPPRNQSFELQVSREDETIHISSDQLGPWVHDQLSAMVRDGDLEQGAQLLAANSELTEPEARQFLQIMAERDRQRDTDL